MDSTLFKLFGGNASRIATPEIAANISTDNTDNIVIGVLLSILFVLFNVMLYRHKRTIVDIFQIFRLKDHLSKLVYEQNSSHKRLHIWCSIISLFAVVILTLRINNHFQILDIDIYHFIITVLVVIFGIFIYRILLLKVIGVCTGRMDFTRKLTFQNNILFSITTITITPCILIGLMSSGTLWNITIFTIGILLILNTLTAINRSFTFFIDKKISIFQWFLYLCGVEIIPWSFVFALIFKQ